MPNKTPRPNLEDNPDASTKQSKPHTSQGHEPSRGGAPHRQAIEPFVTAGSSLSLSPDAPEILDEALQPAHAQNDDELFSEHILPTDGHDLDFGVIPDFQPFFFSATTNIDQTSGYSSFDNSLPVNTGATLPSLPLGNLIPAEVAWGGPPLGSLDQRESWNSADVLSGEFAQDYNSLSGGVDAFNNGTIGTPDHSLAAPYNQASVGGFFPATTLSLPDGLASWDNAPISNSHGSSTLRSDTSTNTLLPSPFLSEDNASIEPKVTSEPSQNNSHQGSVSSYSPTPNSQLKRTSSREESATVPRTISSLKFIHYDPSAVNEEQEKDVDSGVEMARKTKKTVLKNKQGEIAGMQIVMGSRPTKRAALPPKKRKETALARQNGICERCRLAKKRCDLAQKPTPYEKCSGCYARTYRDLPRMPCFQSDLRDSTFFRIIPVGPQYTPRRAIYALEDPSEEGAQVKTITITQSVGGHDLTIYAAKFIPTPEDKVAYIWTDSDGNQQSMPMPHYCITCIPEITRNIMQYITRSKWSYIEMLKKSDPLAWKTLSMASQYARNKVGSLIDNVVNLWVASRLIEITWEMCGSETLGTEIVTDPHNPFFGTMMLPPMMDVQFDQIVIQEILTPLKTTILEKLQAQIQKHSAASWFETYLVIFTLLNHIAWSAKHGKSFATDFGIKTRYCDMREFEGYFHTAKMLLSRFHFVCNGSAPLRSKWTSPETLLLAKLQSHEIEFMGETQVEILRRETELLQLREKHKYESDLYWCQQMFFDNWDSGSPNIEDEVF